jgi:hypothetical protein
MMRPLLVITLLVVVLASSSFLLAAVPAVEVAATPDPYGPGMPYATWGPIHPTDDGAWEQQPTVTAYPPPDVNAGGSWPWPIRIFLPHVED